MTETGTTSPCRGCGYDLQGVELPVCPECGGTVPEPEPERDVALIQRVVADRGLTCRHCRRPLAEITDGTCACGATYQLSATPRTRAMPHRAGGFVDVVALIGAIAGAAIALTSVVFSGIARANDPPWLAVFLATGPAVLLAVWFLVRPAVRSMSGEVRLLLQAGLLGMGLFCLGAAILRLL